MLTEISDIEIYDRGIYQYLSTICDKVTYSTTESAARSITRDSNYKDDIPYQFISFYREPNFEIDMDRYNFTAATVGDRVRLRESQAQNGKYEARYVQNIPVNLTYQIDLWSSKAKGVQKLAIDLISKIYMKKQVVLANMNPDGEPARFHITNCIWTDNSDIEAESEHGKLYRHTISITIDARIKLTRTEDVEEFCFDCNNVYIY